MRVQIENPKNAKTGFVPRRWVVGVADGEGRDEEGQQELNHALYKDRKTWGRG